MEMNQKGEDRIYGSSAGVPNKREKRRLIRYGGNDDDDDEVANKCVFVDTDRNMSIYMPCCPLHRPPPHLPVCYVGRKKKKMIVAKSGMDKKERQMHRRDVHMPLWCWLIRPPVLSMSIYIDLLGLSLIHI